MQARFFSRLWFAVVMALCLLAVAPPAPAQANATLEVFVREGCPHCEDAKRYLATLQCEHPGLEVVVRDVGVDAAARDDLVRLAREHAGGVVAVPAFHARGAMLVGFVDARASGPAIAALAGLTGAARAPPSTTLVTLPWLGAVSVEALGLPLFALLVGALDGFNPCSMWVLLLMVSLLAGVGDRRRMLAVAGTFVIVQGVAYFAFLAAWLNVFLLVGLSRASELVLGAVALAAGIVHLKNAVAPGSGPTLAIPAAAKPGIYARLRNLVAAESIPAAVAGAVVLAVLVQFVELLCTAGLPALFTRILTLQELSPAAYYGHLGLYIVAYLLDDAVVLGIGVATLSRARLQEGGARRLNQLSGLVMVALGLYLLLPLR
jgi:glutaredoxin